MKAVCRLLYTYFTCTAAAKLLSAIGLCLIVVTWILLPNRLPTFAIGVVLIVGVASLYIGSSMMPLMLGRMARNQTVRTVPGARVKLLASALITLFVVAMPLPVLVVYGLMASVSPGGPAPTAAQLARFHTGLIQTFWMSTSTSLLVAGWLYVVLWFITSQRNTTGFLKGLAVIAVIMFLPTRNIADPGDQIRWSLLACAANLLGFSVLFLTWPRLRSAVARFKRKAGSSAHRKFRIGGRVIDLLLGTANPWILAIGQLIPIALATRIGFYSAAVWLYYLTLFSTVSGAIAGQAAERSRALWLRGDWSPAQLFVRVERSFWRHNCVVLGVLLILMVAIGGYEKLPVVLIVTGLPLLVLGTTLSTYLGLMITRGLAWPESVLAVAVMLALMSVAVLAARSSGDLGISVTLEAALALLAAVLRHLAKSRWTRIDWLQCRPDRALSARSAASHH